MLLVFFNFIFQIISGQVAIFCLQQPVGNLATHQSHRLGHQDIQIFYQVSRTYKYFTRSPNQKNIK
jgi:hypothetical protein